MIEREVYPGQLYRHFKGMLYQIVTVAIHSETGEKLVIYQKLYGDYQVHARPYDMFLSEVDHRKYPEVTQKYRFELVDVSQLHEKNDHIVTNEKKTEEVLQAPFSDVVYGEQEDSSGADVRLLAFLDADTFEEKKRVLVSIKNEITDRLIDDMAASIDVAVEEGDIEDRYHSLLNCINTRAKFEVDRFR